MMIDLRRYQDRINSDDSDPNSDSEWEALREEYHAMPDWRLYQNEIPLLPSPRLRPLTPRGVREDRIERPVAASQESPWFNLPSSLRKNILQLAFGGELLHLDLIFNLYHRRGDKSVTGATPATWGRIGPVCDRDLYVNKRERRGEMPHYGPWSRTCFCIEAARDSEFGHIGVMGWLLSCRQNHAETIDVLYSANTFCLNEKAISYLPQLLVPERFAAMTSLEMIWKLEDDTLLESVFSLLSEERFPNLRQLLVSVEKGERDLPGAEAVLAQIHDFVKSRPQIVEYAFAVPAELTWRFRTDDDDDDDDEPDDSAKLGHQFSDFMVPMLGWVHIEKDQFWRSLDGKMHRNRLPYADSYPKPPFHLSGDDRVGYWLLAGEAGVRPPY
ncbi:hypothetical protein ACHAPI_011139 [Fusarium lateritium]